MSSNVPGTPSVDDSGISRSRSHTSSDTQTPLRLFFSVGDISADLHAANLIREVRKMHPDVIIEGMGGLKMAEAGCDIHYDLTNMNTSWFRRLFAEMGQFMQLLRLAVYHIEQHRPDAVVLVDYSGYNLILAGRLRSLHIPVVYYICPQLWASRPGRMKKMRKRITKVLCILPFEVSLYEDAGVPVEFVGHPLFDHLDSVEIDEKFCRGLRGEAGDLIIGLCPGSRSQEIRNLLPVMCRAAEVIRQKHPDALFVIPCAADRHRPEIDDILADFDFGAKVYNGRTFEIMKEADFCMVASGTATLELAHFNTPMLVVYRVSWFSWWLAKLMMKSEFIAMVNVLSGREVVPERLLWRDDHEELAREALRIIDDPERHAEVEKALAELRATLDHPGASRKAAESIIECAMELRGVVPDYGSQWK